jgi:hypothetical protein
VPSKARAGGTTVNWVESESAGNLRFRGRGPIKAPTVSTRTMDANISKAVAGSVSQGSTEGSVNNPTATRRNCARWDTANPPVSEAAGTALVRALGPVKARAASTRVGIATAGARLPRAPRRDPQATAVQRDPRATRQQGSAETPRRVKWSASKSTQPQRGREQPGRTMG